MNSIINAIDTNSITTANVTSWIAPTDSDRGLYATLISTGLWSP